MTRPRESADQFRAELRAWCAEHPPPAIAVASSEAEAEVLREWQRTLHSGHWVGIHWPEEHGGRGAAPSEVAVYNEELARIGAPPLLGRAGVTLVGPTLIAHGTPEQRTRWLPRILSGDDVWCQLFSEPDAGSDLTSLRTRAVREGDAYRVSGQKVWSSYARFADLGIALVRTNESERGHRGISMLAIPMHADGVSVLPLRQMTGESEFCEVFLDDVLVPADHLVGAEHEGWAVANTTLANERGASFIWREQVLQEMATDRLVAACARERRSTDPVVRQRLARCWIDTQIFRLHNSRTLEKVGRGDPIGAESSLVKLHWANSSQRLYDEAVTTLGPGALLTERDEHGDWAHDFLATRANSIMGGTNEIQRTIIAERMLGLPREPRS
ncbi:MAG TPA: acyl-CoA dehydrogenase family protein [Acidimicrobiia bacterium]|jgi:alkylation response protein AidB-like acyl-CoA dehydrogenase